MSCRVWSCLTKLMMNASLCILKLSNRLSRTIECRKYLRNLARSKHCAGTNATSTKGIFYLLLRYPSCCHTTGSFVMATEQLPTFFFFRWFRSQTEDIYPELQSIYHSSPVIVVYCLPDCPCEHARATLKAEAVLRVREISSTAIAACPSRGGK